MGSSNSSMIRNSDENSSLNQSINNFKPSKIMNTDIKSYGSKST